MKTLVISYALLEMQLAHLLVLTLPPKRTQIYSNLGNVFSALWSGVHDIFPFGNILSQTGLLRPLIALIFDEKSSLNDVETKNQRFLKMV